MVKRKGPVGRSVVLPRRMLNMHHNAVFRLITPGIIWILTVRRADDAITSP
jgi:hypothetical protein